ncbi:MAG: Lar family restriction alleviation protein [Lachnospiraceae bacterium]|nr:Lar family restriction alleviation protein [Lachnospiraceae bacterium]
MSELKSCPFCGGKASENLLTEITKYDLYTVSCENNNCGVHPHTVGLTYEEAVTKWNNRASGWIPVSDRLPDKGKINTNIRDYQQYMCLVDCKGTGGMDARPLGFDKTGKWVNGGIDMSKYVIAWQPLPKPYKGERQ